ncbi:MAG: hypothetical protein J2P57_14740 [Acidimicrobiaceae bacterium]|nr:hypothetical protein [Acidimicrobiaceae bacterium]
MVTWGEFARTRPDLAEAGRQLFYQFGVGLAFLASVRPDGGPRLHPICPLFSPPDGLFGFVIDSPKQRDLRRDGRYALHSFPCPDNEDAVCITGMATLVEDEAVREQVADQFVAERAAFGVPRPSGGDALVRFDISSMLLTRTTGHGDPSPAHTIWHAP